MSNAYKKLTAMARTGAHIKTAAKKNAKAAWRGIDSFQRKHMTDGLLAKALFDAERDRAK